MCLLVCVHVHVSASEWYNKSMLSVFVFFKHLHGNQIGKMSNSVTQEWSFLPHKDWLLVHWCPWKTKPYFVCLKNPGCCHKRSAQTMPEVAVTSNMCSILHGLFYCGHSFFHAYTVNSIAHRTLVLYFVEHSSQDLSVVFCWAYNVTFLKTASLCLVRAMFSCVQTMARLPVLGVLNVPSLCRVFLCPNNGAAAGAWGSKCA